MNSFYIHDILPETKIIQLSEDESKHAIRVLRMKLGDSAFLLDGKGRRFLAEIMDDHPKRCQFEVKTVEFEAKNSFHIHIAIAPTKNMDRIEWFLEKACELGLDELSLIICKNSERKSVNIDRLEKIAISAMKQSKRLYLPIIHELCTFQEFIEKHPKGAIAHCFENDKKSLKNCIKATNYPILIGPEGDFSLDELEKIAALEYDFVTLGKNRLRTETAGIFACASALIEFTS
jgi:16S rRNA (uracil1498-N3)-methyltransferase